MRNSARYYCGREDSGGEKVSKNARKTGLGFVSHTGNKNFCINGVGLTAGLLYYFGKFRVVLMGGKK